MTPIIAPGTLCRVVGVPPPIEDRVVEVIGAPTILYGRVRWYPVQAEWLRKLIEADAHMMQPEHLRPILPTV